MGRDGIALRQVRRFEEASVAMRQAVQIFAEVGDDYTEDIARRHLEILRAGIDPKER